MGKGIRMVAAVAVGLSLALGPMCARAHGDESVDALKKMVEDLSKKLEEVTKKLEEVEKKQTEQAAAPAAAAPAAPAPAAPAKPKGLLDVYWKDGIRLDSAEAENGVKPFQLKLSGRIQADAAWNGEDDELATVAESEDGVEFRRARLQVSGIIYRDFDFQLEYDFAEGTSAPKDVYVSANNIPYVGTIRVGHFKEYASLDELVSDNDTIFIERGLPNVFAPSRNFGVGMTNAFFDKRMTASIGLFRETNDFAGGGVGDDNWAVTGRITGLPYYYSVKTERVDKLQLVHVGGWASYREVNRSGYRLRQRPENHIAPRYLDTFNTIGDIDSQTEFGVELATIYGPFTAQSEYMLTSLDREGESNAMMQGAYVQAAYLLTGEHRLYKNQQGVLDKVVPLKNFQISGDTRGPGAWELAMRWSWLDFQDDTVTGGSQHDLTAGVNWYLNPNMRVSFNYIHGWVERDDDILLSTGANPTDPADDVIQPAVSNGDYDGFLMRFQVTW